MASVLTAALAAGLGSRPAFAHAHGMAGPGANHSHRPPRIVNAGSWRRDPQRRRDVREKLFTSSGSAERPSMHSAAGSDSSERSGIASVYSDHHTASGETMNPGAMTAAHRTLPFGTEVTVFNHSNGRSAVVRINDRGPFVRGRVIDLSPAAARALGVDGLAKVSLSVGRVAGHESSRPLLL
jgi:rare lipoprotein A